MAVTVPSFIPEPFANEGQYATIPDTPSSEQGRASWQQGFPQVCAQPLASGGIPPNYLDFQGIFNALSSSICYMQTGALWPWSSTLTYPLGAHVLGSDNNEYVAVQENSGQDPTQDPTNVYWLRADAGDGVPVGTIVWSAASAAPNGYLLCNGATVGRETYSALFSAIGTTYGAGDGSTTFALPNLIGRVMWGGTSPGAYLAAGLPNIKGDFSLRGGSTIDIGSGAISMTQNGITATQSQQTANTAQGAVFALNAAAYNPIYSDSVDTVQPPALTLVPYIKAFSAATNQGMIDLTALANDIAALDADRLQRIGQIDYFARGTLPEGWVVADGSLILFADYPEFEAAYKQGLFNSMVLESTASEDEKNTWRGKWVKNAQGTGLYTPRLQGLFLRNAGSVGKYNVPGMPEIAGQLSVGFVEGQLATFNGSGALGSLQSYPELYGGGSQRYDGSTYGGITIIASRSNQEYGAQPTVMPASADFLFGLYLGRTS